MPRRFELDDYYSLLGAFDRLGKPMFGDDWTGEEPWARPIEDPTATISRRRELFGDLRSQKERLARVSELYTLAAGTEEAQAYSDSTGKLLREIAELEQQIRDLPTYSDFDLKEYQARKRYEAVDAELRLALNQERLRLTYGRDVIVDWKHWSKQAGFRLYLSTSTMIAPRNEVNSRRAPVFAKRSEIEMLCDEIQPLVGEDPRTPEQKATVWFKEQARQPQRFGKAGYLAEAREKFSDLSERKFNLIWEKFAPDSWKEPGPKKKAPL